MKDIKQKKENVPEGIFCATCWEVHGRDTRSPIQCPKCGNLVGCFWHMKGTRHILTCKG